MGKRRKDNPKSAWELYCFECGDILSRIPYEEICTARGNTIYVCRRCLEKRKHRWLAGEGDKEGSMK